MKRLNIGPYLVVAVTLFFSGVCIAQQSQTPVCHITDSYDFGSGLVNTGSVISIADPALPSHLDHGDSADFALRERADGEIVCTLVLDSGNGDVVSVGDLAHGGRVVAVNPTGTHGLVIYDGHIRPPNRGNGEVNWYAAKEFASFVDGSMGYLDWRLPTRTELAFVVRYVIATAQITFIEAGQPYWTGTEADARLPYFISQGDLDDISPEIAQEEIAVWMEFIIGPGGFINDYIQHWASKLETARPLAVRTF